MPRDRCNVLLIEDNPGDARLLRELLKDATAIRPELVHASLLAEGLDLLAKGGVDVAILDLSLPDAQGIETVVRAHAAAPSVPLVVLTGLDDEVTAIRAVREGAQDYLVKGRFDGDHLARAILYAVERKRAEENARHLTRVEAARELAEAAAERSRFLAEASRALASSLDYDATVARIAALAVPSFAAACAVDVVDETRRSRRAATAGDAALLDGIDRLGAEEALTAPLCAGGRTLGALTFAAGAGRRYGPGDAAFAVELAALAALALDNARLYQEAQRALQAREDMLAIVSHDLRNPLGVVTMGSSMLLRMLLGDEHGERMVSKVQLILRSAKRMEELIRDLLDAASIEAGRLTLALEEHAAGALVTEALDMTSLIAAEKTIRLAGDVACPDVLVTCDLGRVRQVFSNLLGNALKFTPAEGRVTVRAREDGDFVEFSVADTGPGIPADQLPHVFDRYWQAKQSYRAGVGLGLFIVQGIVLAHGGEIRVESEVGAGTRFLFRLPKAPP
jgi:signal transduction histidine kinase/DNA-binding NarL/FixJ family response regulator